MRLLVLLLAACSGSNGHLVDATQPTDSASDARPLDAELACDGIAPPGWGSACQRNSYGAVPCTNGSGAGGWCVPFHGADVCMPGCTGVDYACSPGQCQAFNEGSECYCVSR